MSSPKLRKALTTLLRARSMNADMQADRIHRGKQPRRPHFIEEWAELRGYATQADLAEALGADKSVISRWYKGATPGEEWQLALADLFSTEPDGIFRHPNDDWISRFFQNRSREEFERMKTMLEAAFPREKGRANGT